MCFSWKKKSPTVVEDTVWTPPDEADEEEQEERESVEEKAGCNPKSCPNKLPCHVCKHTMKDTTIFTSLYDGRSFRIQKHLNCRTPFCVYLIECQNHPVQYVGSSKKDFNKRWSDHKKDLNQVLGSKRDNCEDKTNSSGLANHFRDVYHAIEDNVHLDLPLKVTIIDSGKDELDMKQREAYWIAKLGTLRTKSGLNRQQAISQKAFKLMNESFGIQI